MKTRCVFQNISLARARFSQRRASRAGAACIEMALVAPVLFVILFASVEFARMMMIKQSLTNAAREGCRDAALITTQHHDDVDTTIRDYLKGAVQFYNDENIVRVDVDPPFVTAPGRGTQITAYVEVDCADVSWLPPAFCAGAKISGTATMHRE